MDSKAVNRDFYDALWSECHLESADKFNTWPLIAGLLPVSRTRLEIGPGLRPRLPIYGTCFVDISKPVVDRLTKGGGHAIYAEIDDLPYNDQEFELVCVFDVIEHVEDDRRVFSEVCRVLKDGGLLVFSVPIHARLWTGFDELVGHIRRYDPADLLILLAANNLVLEKSAAFGMQSNNPRLLGFSMWWLKHRRKEAMWWYNKVLLPIGMRFQKKLKFMEGMIDVKGVDEIVLVCRKITTT
jgi:SAM-dependent methyltransferase